MKNEEKSQSGKKADITRENIAQLITQISSKHKNQKGVYQKMFDPKDEEEEKLLPSDEKT